MRKKTPRRTSPKTSISKELVDQSELGSKTTAIHIPHDTWRLLRAVAFKRAQESGGRASVSAVIQALVAEHWAELEAEVAVHHG